MSYGFDNKVDIVNGNEKLFGVKTKKQIKFGSGTRPDQTQSSLDNYNRTGSERFNDDDERIELNRSKGGKSKFNS